MTRKPETISFWRGVLPHWEVADGRYFVTLRLANSLPRRVAEELASQLRDASEADYLKKTRAYFVQLEQWLDRDTEHTWLQRPEIADAVTSSIEHYNTLGCWHVIAGVIMPNHIHLFFRCGICSLGQVMRDFKRYTGRACNEVLGRQGRRFWQRDWFDHWSRSAQEDDRIVSYIHRNPERAGLVGIGEDWPWTISRESMPTRIDRSIVRSVSG